MYEEEIIQKTKRLPDDLKKEVLKFIDTLMKKRKGEVCKKGKKFKFDWEGGLSELKDKTNSVELQRKALEWR